MLEFVGKTRVRLEGRDMVFFGGNDYHRLSRHEEVLEATRRAIDLYGLSTSGSRATSGNHPLYEELEEALARYLGVEDALLLPSGYLGSIAAADALTGPGVVAATFPCPHPSIADAVLKFQAGGAAEVLFAEGVEANTGRLLELSSHPTSLVLDDAHGIGTVGPGGKGTAALLGLDNTLLVGTLSKAFGAYGGFVAARRQIVDAARKNSGAYVGTTPIPLPIASAGLTAVRLLSANPSWADELQLKTLRVRARLAKAGLKTNDSPAPILSITFGDDARNGRAAATLAKKGIYPNFINYPGCPPGGHFRMTLSSAHSTEEVEGLVACLVGLADELL
jgi:7-keto-8-aminopelargonate synthetase-like enzyme